MAMQPLTACVLSEWYLVQVEVAASQFVRFEVCSGSVFGHVCILHVEFFLCCYNHGNGVAVYTIQCVCVCVCVCVCACVCVRVRVWYVWCCNR